MSQNIGVARILSGVHYSSPKKLTTFLVVVLKTHAELKLPNTRWNYLNNRSHRPDLPNFLEKVDSCFASGVHSLPGWYTYNFPL